jgi:glucose-6-phosphate dehydrogenase assembly protein OpcA
MTANSTPTSLGQRAHVDIRAIERELTELWKHIAEDSEKRQAVTRICVLNLVVVTLGGRAAERATETVARLMARYPNRAIVINAVPSAQEEFLDAWVQAHCQMPGPGRPQVCGEQVTIEARGAAVDRVPGTILPLLVPDVPVVLWWPRGEPLADPRFVKLSSLVDRVILDSATFVSPEAGLVALSQLIGATTAISDLSWSRLTPWRELTAQFFDVPALAPHLAEIERVIIEYEAQPGAVTDRSQALLLVGWLASRLGWRPHGGAHEQGGVTTLHMARAVGDDVAVELRPAEAKDDLLDRLVTVTVECRRARFLVASHDAPDCAVTRAEADGMPPLQRKVRLEHLDEAGLIGQELRLLGRDQTFEAALKIAAALVD